MKFNCGPDKAEKFRLERERLLKQQENSKEWKKMFAWFPIRVGSYDCRWLEFIETRKQYYFYEGDKYNNVGSWLAREYRAYET